MVKSKFAQIPIKCMLFFLVVSKFVSIGSIFQGIEILRLEIPVWQLATTILSSLVKISSSPHRRNGPPEEAL